MKLSEAQAKYIFTTRIELEDEGDYIVLREPTTLEMREFGEDGKKNADLLIKLFPTCIIEHSFENDDGTLSDTKAVANFLLKSGTLYTRIIETWMEALPIKKKKEKESDK